MSGAVPGAEGVCGGRGNPTLILTPQASRVIRPPLEMRDLVFWSRFLGVVSRSPCSACNILNSHRFGSYFHFGLISARAEWIKISFFPHSQYPKDNIVIFNINIQNVSPLHIRAQRRKILCGFDPERRPLSVFWATNVISLDSSTHMVPLPMPSTQSMLRPPKAKKRETPQLIIN